MSLVSLAAILALTSAVAARPVAAAPEGQMTWAVHISLAPTWFEPAETSGMITPFMVLYAMHDALVKREQVLHRIQQLLHDKVVYAPIWELAFLSGQGPRVAESGLGLISNHAYSAPYEDVRLKKP
jgi:hypothetical protein